MADRTTSRKHAAPHWSLAQRLDYFSRRDANGCRIWQRKVDAGGYGCMRWKHKVNRVHRLAWISVHGEIPDGKFVLHRCDVRACSNPDHLFLGDHATNMADMSQKKRSAWGVKSARAFWSPDRVLQVYRAPGSHYEIARAFGVSRRVVGYIKNKQRWRHLLESEHR